MSSSPLVRRFLQNLCLSSGYILSPQCELCTLGLGCSLHSWVSTPTCFVMLSFLLVTPLDHMFDFQSGTAFLLSWIASISHYHLSQWLPGNWGSPSSVRLTYSLEKNLIDGYLTLTNHLTWDSSFFWTISNVDSSIIWVGCSIGLYSIRSGCFIWEGCFVWLVSIIWVGSASFRRVAPLEFLTMSFGILDRWISCIVWSLKNTTYLLRTIFLFIESHSLNPSSSLGEPRYMHYFALASNFVLSSFRMWTKETSIFTFLTRVVSLKVKETNFKPLESAPQLPMNALECAPQFPMYLNLHVYLNAN